MYFRGTQLGSSGGPSTVTKGSWPFATRVLLMSGTASAARPSLISASARMRSISVTVIASCGPVCQVVPVPNRVNA